MAGVLARGKRERKVRLSGEVRDRMRSVFVKERGEIAKMLVSDTR